MFAGPIIAREVMTSPRPARFYIARASYVGILFILMWTVWQSLIGWREVREFGVLARFSGILFQFFVLIQLTLMLFFAPISAAAAVAHEKDRRTFVLLLMTDLRDTEIVLGKLTASLLQIVTLLALTAPVFFLCMLLGGIAPAQIFDILGVTAAAGVAGGALGLLVALGRDRTFQSLALTVLLVVLSLAGIEAIGYLAPGLSIAGVPLATGLNPYRAILSILYKDQASLSALARPSIVFITMASLLASGILLASIYLLRIWNPGRNEPREEREGEESETQEGSLIAIETFEESQSASPVPAIGSPSPALKTGESPEEDGSRSTGLHVPRRSHRRVLKKPGQYRKPWSEWPVLWRELMTRAYGTKPLVIKAAYFVAFALGVAFYHGQSDLAEDSWKPAKTLIPLAILSLVLVNTQGVTALTSERDTGALDLLLVTELSPKQFIYGKLYGVLYNTKEMIILPILLTLWFAIRGDLTWESAVYVIIDFLLLAHFSAMLGLHAAITYTNSRTAVANSLGTIFFLMIGILVCASLILLSDREFGRQLLSFLIFIGAGSVALFGSLGAKNPSRAIALVSLLTPFWSFYCVISLLNHDILAAFLFSVGIYGFACLAMLVPAVSDFDIALGRTSAIQG